MTEKISLAHIASPILRMVRSGSSLGAPKNLKGAQIRATMTALRARLDELEVDRESSPRERRRDAVAAVNAARVALRGEASRIEGEKARLAALAEKVTTATRRQELAVSPFRIEILKSRVPSIRASENPGRDFDQALRARDIDQLLAIQLAFPQSDRARAGIACLLAPQEFGEYATNARDTYQSAGSLAALDRGLAELAEHETPWDGKLLADPATIIEAAADPLRFASVDAQTLVPNDLPQFLRDRALPTTQSPADNVTPETAWGPGESTAAAAAQADLDGEIGGAA